MMGAAKVGTPSTRGHTNNDEPDPELLSDALVRGIVSAVSQSLLEEKWSKVAVESLRLLCDARQPLVAALNRSIRL